ncbi:30S ribosomal protein S9 [Aureibacter tunicatorum]|uniref:Small ribosomal subunit protein uS9 n=1 Tax=Aureibacter tunicatorum TaxID=866807 RepID=A0AAE3XJL9_9BACT|nr:30S ribosomal protein S9 [Aureibacter tunicatorum]MDR6238097.1 small subunit ribosomal protein S9 [Aureibacter tunicatorum]BDD03130.1 30S ribosomal protein S9 [Aureibacter tunicatorum]
MEVINTSGRRKTSVARLYLTAGSGNITVNNRALEDYFPAELLRIVVNQPLTLTENTGKYDIKINVTGGGFKGQAEAIRLAVAKALDQIDGELRPAMKAEGFLTRDPRMVERKKYGQKKARRKFQFSKR